MDINNISKDNTNFFEKVGSSYYTIVDLLEDFPYSACTDCLYVGAANFNSTTKSSEGNLTKDQLSIEITQNDDNCVTDLKLIETVPPNNQYYKIQCTIKENTKYSYRYCKFKLKNTHTKSILSYTIRQEPYIDTNGYYVHIYITNTSVLTNVLYNSNYTHALYSFKFEDTSKNSIEYINVIFVQDGTNNKYKSYLYTQEEIPTNQSIHYIMGLSEQSITGNMTSQSATSDRPNPTNLRSESVITSSFSPYSYIPSTNVPNKSDYGNHIGYTLFPHLMYSSSNWKLTPEKKYLYKNNDYPDINNFSVYTFGSANAYFDSMDQSNGYEIVIALK